MNVRGHHRDRSRLTRNDLRLGDGQRIDQAQTRAANVEGCAAFARANCGMQLSGERRIEMVRFAGRDNGVDLFGVAAGGMQRFSRGLWIWLRSICPSQSVRLVSRS